MSAASSEMILSFGQIGAMLRARRRLILWVLSLSMLLALVGSLVIPKTYIASSDLYIDYRVNDPINGRQFHPMQDESYLETQFDFLKSIQVAERVVETLKLQDTPKGKVLVAKLGEARGRRAVAENIVKNIDVTTHKSSRVVEVAYSSDDPVQAKDIVNALVRSYIELTVEMMNAPANERRDLYNDQLQNMSKQIDDLQTKMTQYQQEHGIVDLDEHLDSDSKQMNALTSKLIEVQLQKMDAQNKQQSLEKMLNKGSSAADIPDLIGMGNLEGLKDALSDLDAKIASARANWGPNHPKMIALEQERASLVRRMGRASGTTVDSLRATVQRLTLQEQQLLHDVDDAKKKTLENKKDRDVIGSYKRQLESVQSVYHSAIQKYDEILMTSRVSISNTVVMRWAEVPDQYAKPIMKKNLLFGLIAGVFLGFSLAFLFELAHRRVRCIDDLKREMALPLLGQIGFSDVGESGVIGRFFSGSSSLRLPSPVGASARGVYDRS